MITVTLTSEQFVTIGRLVEAERVAMVAARDSSEWPERDYSAAMARLLAQTSDTLAAAVREKVAATRKAIL